MASLNSIAQIPDTMPNAGTKFDISQILDFCRPSQQVMVYGWYHCHYDFLYSALASFARQKESPIKKVFDYRVGQKALYNNSIATTFEGREMNILRTSNGRDGQIFKMGLVHLVLENYKRKKEGKALIPLIFCFDVDDNPYPCKLENITSKKGDMNRMCTHQELRRIYKLLRHSNPKIAAIARETFHFVRMNKLSEKSFSVQPIANPLDTPEMDMLWEIRKKSSKPKDKLRPWRDELDRHIARFDRMYALEGNVVAKALALIALKQAQR